jgi:hypothetical protein
MKRLLLAVCIFILGALSYALIGRMLPAAQKDETPSAQTPAPASSTPVAAPVAKTATDTQGTDAFSVIDDAALAEGPFPITDKDGTKVAGTVRLVISPEETLLQFENFSSPYTLPSRIYLSKDLNADEYLNIAPAKLDEGLDVYGIPPTEDLSAYRYMLIYDPQTDVVEYQARVQ